MTGLTAISEREWDKTFSVLTQIVDDVIERRGLPPRNTRPPTKKEQPKSK
jgi:hypothetical protein